MLYSVNKSTSLLRPGSQVARIALPHEPSRHVQGWSRCVLVRFLLVPRIIHHPLPTLFARVDTMNQFTAFFFDRTEVDICSEHCEPVVWTAPVPVSHSALASSEMAMTDTPRKPGADLGFVHPYELRASSTCPGIGVFVTAPAPKGTAIWDPSKAVNVKVEVNVPTNPRLSAWHSKIRAFVWGPGPGICSQHVDGCMSPHLDVDLQNRGRTGCLP